LLTGQLCGTWNPRSFSRSVGKANREASCWRSGLRCHCKRRPCCNGRDTGFDIPGSVRRLIVAGASSRESGMNQFHKGEQMTCRVSAWCALKASAILTVHHYREVPSAFGAGTTKSRTFVGA